MCILFPHVLLPTNLSDQRLFLPVTVIGEVAASLRFCFPPCFCGHRWRSPREQRLLSAVGAIVCVHLSSLMSLPGFVTRSAPASGHVL